MFNNEFKCVYVRVCLYLFYYIFIISIFALAFNDMYLYIIYTTQIRI